MRSRRDPRSHGHRVTAEGCFVIGTDNREEAGAVDGTEPDVTPAQREAALQYTNHIGQPLFGRPARSKHLSDFRQDLETRMLRGQRRRDHSLT